MEVEAERFYELLAGVEGKGEVLSGCEGGLGGLL